MKKRGLIFCLFLSFFYCSNAYSEEILGGRVEVERHPNEIRIVFSPNNQTHVRAAYTYYTSGSLRGVGQLRVDNREHQSIIITINTNESMDVYIIGSGQFNCSDRRNRVICSSARMIFGFWRARLNVERRIEEAMRIPPLDPSLYLPPEK